MAKIEQPYLCDICQQAKRPSNGWFCAFVESPETEAVRVIVVKWNDELAEREDVRHICGIDCGSRWLVKELARIYGNQVG